MISAAVARAMCSVVYGARTRRPEAVSVATVVASELPPFGECASPHSYPVIDAP